MHDPGSRQSSGPLHPVQKGRMPLRQVEMRTQDQEGLPEQVSHPRERQRSRSLRFNLSERKNRTDRRTRNPSRW